MFTFPQSSYRVFLSVFVVVWFWIQARFLHCGWLSGLVHIYRFSSPSLFLPLTTFQRRGWVICSVELATVCILPIRFPRCHLVSVCVPCTPLVVLSGVLAGFRISVFLPVCFIGGMWTSVRRFPMHGCLPNWLAFTGFSCCSLQVIF